MTTELIKVSNSINELNIIVSKEEFDSAYNKHLNELKKQIKMPGFRPGKVPASLIQKLHGESLKLETQEHIANEQYQGFTKQNDVSILSQPSITDIKIDDNGSQIYTIRFEVMPEFEPKDYKQIEIYEPYHKVTDEEVEKELAHISIHFGSKSEVDTISNYNVIVNAEGRLFKNGQDVTTIEQSKPYNIQLYNEINDIKELLLNHKIGDTVTYKSDNSGDNLESTITIKAITQITPHVINEEFVKLASSNKFDNIEDFRQDIGFAMQKQWDDQTNELMREQVMWKVTELHNDIELPTSLVQMAKSNFINSLKKNNKNDKLNLEEPTEQEHITVASERLARMEMVRDNIIRHEKIEIEDYDYENLVDEFLAGYAQAGQPSIFDRDTVLKHIKEDEQVKGNLMHKKYTDFLLDFANTTEIDYDEYITNHRNKSMGYSSNIQG